MDLDALLDGIECWRDEDGEPHVTIETREDVFEHWGARHKRLKAFLSGRYYQKAGSALSASGLEDIIRTIEALCYSGPQYKTWRRIGRDGDYVYFDLCDAWWKSVKIGRQGWVVGSFPGAKFLRSPAMRPLPVPVLGGSPGELWPYVNCGSEEDFTLLIGWLVGALNPAGPYLILNLSGEAGSGKSSISELLGNLIDPEVGKKRAVNRDERDMLVAARNAHVLVYDNLSGVSHSLSDSLCRLSTGGGLSARQLHSDADVVILDAMRPLILNGIDTGGRQDLVDRSVSLFLPRLPDAGRRSERELKAEFETIWPLVLGSLLSGVAAGLRNIDRVKLDTLPRMADAAIWIEACLPGLGIEQGAFIAAYEKNRSASKKMLIESDPVGSEIVRIIREYRPMGFIGSASVLLDLLNEHAPQTAKSMRAWPSTPAACGVAVRRAGELLRAEGFEWGDQRNAEGRKIKISPVSVSPAVHDGPLPED